MENKIKIKTKTRKDHGNRKENEIVNELEKTKMKME
jgi:hypothetical protein